MGFIEIYLLCLECNVLYNVTGAIALLIDSHDLVVTIDTPTLITFFEPLFVLITITKIMLPYHAKNDTLRVSLAMGQVTLNVLHEQMVLPPNLPTLDLTHVPVARYL